MRRTVRRVLCALAVATLVAACGSDPTDPPRITASTPPASEPPSAIFGTTALLAVARSEHMGRVAHAADGEEFTRHWQEFGFEVAAPQVDFERYVVLFYSRAEDGCPDEFAGMDVEDGRLRVDWQAPPGACQAPLIPTSFAIAVHRNAVPSRFVAFLEGFHEDYDDVEHDVVLEDYRGPSPELPPPRTTAPEPRDVAGTAELPSRGDAITSRLDDGTPVWVVHHQNGAVSVLGADAPVVRSGTRVTGLHSQVGWVGLHRRFGGAGWFDEYGVSLGGFVDTNLDRYAAAVRDGEVAIGDVAGPAPYRVPDPPPIEDRGPVDFDFPDDPRASQPASPEAALERPDGTVVILDAALVAYATQPLRLCAPPQPPDLWDWDGCPEDAPVPDGLSYEQADPDSFNVWFGPLRVRVQGDTFIDVVLLGGGTAGGTIEQP